MKVTGLSLWVVPVNHRGNWVFAELRTDAGLAGAGEASHSGDDVRCVAALRQFGERLLGEDPRRVGALAGELSSQVDGLVAATAMSALEQALWDLLGQSLSAPVHALFGGRLREVVPLYANINRGARDRSPENFAARATAAVAEGFKAVKLAPFDEVHHSRMDGPTLLRAAAAGIDRVRAVREAVGQVVDVLVDCHSRFDPATAVQVAAALAPLGIYWFEEPVRREPVSLLAEVRRRVSMPVAAGEEFFGAAGFAELIERHACDYVMPDVKHCGGLQALGRIASLAETHGVAVAPHNPAGPLSTLASVQACAVLPNLWRLEYQWGEVPWRAEVLNPPECLSGGAIPVPAGPGLGAALNREFLKPHVVPT